jgi:gliding motility-associated-like protein
VNPQGKYYVGSTTVNNDGSWTYEPTEPFTGTLVATATDADGNTSEFSLCYTPCSARASLNDFETSIYLETPEAQTLSLTSTSVFSNLTPVPGKIYWMVNSADTLNSISNTSPQNFQISVTGDGDITAGQTTIYLIAKQAGCVDTAKVSIRVLFIPNLITPNGDGKNDQWFISNTGGLYEVSIYNRWGDKVFTAEDYTDGFAAQELSDGSYFYELVEKGEGEKYKGWLQVVK